MYRVIKSGSWFGSEIWYNALNDGFPLDVLPAIIRSEFDDYEDTDLIKAKYVRQIIDKYRDEVN